MIVLDTNVLSEFLKSAPDSRVALWRDRQDRTELHTTTINLAEMLAGARALPAGRRREALTHLIGATFATLFEGKVLPFTASAASHYADALALRRGLGRPIGVLDAQIAAIALSRGARVATRDTDGFSGIGLDLIDPWTA